MARRKPIAEPPYEPEIRPSGLYRVNSCQGSVALCRWADPLPTSEPALLGTCTHYLNEVTVRRNITPDRYIGVELEVPLYDKRGMQGAHKFVVDEKMALSSLAFWQFVNTYRSHEIGTRVLLEREYLMHNVHELLEGTCDLTIVGKRRIIFADYKNGYGYVPELGNKQLAAYGVGGLNKFGTDFEEMLIAVIQPNCFGFPTIRLWRIDDVDAWHKTWIKKLKRITDRAQTQTHVGDKEVQLKLNPGAHCKWCEGILHCSAAKSAFCRVVAARKKGVRALYNLSSEEMNELLKQATCAEEFAKELRRNALVRAKEGEVFENYKMVDYRKKTHRKFRNQTAVVEDLRNMGYGKDDIFDSSLKSPAAIERIVEKGEFEKLKRHIEKPVESFKILVEQSSPLRETKTASSIFGVTKRKSRYDGI